MNDYLWDGSGEPDPEIQRLETRLARYRSERPAPVLPVSPTLRDRIRFRTWWWLPAASTGLGALMVLTWTLVHRSTPTRLASAWQVSSVSGSPQIGGKRISGIGRLAVGEWLVTNSAARATLNVNTVGELRVDPGTRLRLVQSNANRQLVTLERGTIHAMVWAPPGEFVVNTPSATAIDLGCAYTLHVDANGAGLIRVTFGWVAFRKDGVESFIPEGAACATRLGIGPGTPYFENAPAKLRDALATFDFGKPDARADALTVILAQARKHDSLTLWHLLSRSNGRERAKVYDRLAALVPPPSGVTRDGVLSANQKMLDLWWNALGLGDTSWWRLWEHEFGHEGK
jgi:FecR protein